MEGEGEDGEEVPHRAGGARGGHQVRVGAVRLLESQGEGELEGEGDGKDDGEGENDGKVKDKVEVKVKDGK